MPGGGPEAAVPAQPARAGAGMRRAAGKALECAHRVALFLSMVAVVAACLVLAGGAVMRYFLKVSTDWQDEVAVFLLVFMTFGASGWVQAQRAHVAIEAIAGVLPPGVNRLRRRLCDALGFLFCCFFSWKSWALVVDAWSEGMTTESTWAPPLWIPYAIMALGMSLLTLQLLAQTLAAADSGQGAGRDGAGR